MIQGHHFSVYAALHGAPGRRFTAREIADRCIVERGPSRFPLPLALAREALRDLRKMGEVTLTKGKWWGRMERPQALQYGATPATDFLLDRRDGTAHTRVWAAEGHAVTLRLNAERTHVRTGIPVKDVDLVDLRMAVEMLGGTVEVLPAASGGFLFARVSGPAGELGELARAVADESFRNV